MRGILLALLSALSLSLLTGLGSLLPDKTGNLENPAIVEASGLANSAFSSSRFWTINDGGNAPVLYALSSDGKNLGSLRLSGVDNVDWEDLAIFDTAGQRYLVVADIGDNAGKRDSVTLHFVQEPEVLDGKERRVSVNASVHFRYPDGPRDAEALAIDDGFAYVLSKRTRPPVLYRVPVHNIFVPVQSEKSAGESREGRVLVAERLGPVETLPKPDADELAAAPRTGVYAWQPTAMSIRQDGSAAVILTTRNAYIYERRGDEDWLESFSRRPEVRPLIEKLDAESVCFTSTGLEFLTTTEAKHAALFVHALD